MIMRIINYAKRCFSGEFNNCDAFTCKQAVDGFETVEAIAATATGSSGFHQDVPVEEISITDTKVTTE